MYEDETPLRSGWAWGQEKLQGGVAMLEADVGEGTLYMFGLRSPIEARPMPPSPWSSTGSS